MGKASDKFQLKLRMLAKVKGHEHCCQKITKVDSTPVLPDWQLNAVSGEILLAKQSEILDYQES